MLALPLLAFGCRSPPEQPADTGGNPVHTFATGVSIAGDSEDARAFRAELVRGLSAEVRDARVLRAIERTPRHLFVPGVSLERAYVDRPAPIGYGQTISQPKVVAIMTAALELGGQERVLEIGTGSGYQAAVLSSLVAAVYTIELVPELAQQAAARLEQLGYSNVEVRAGDGYRGWPEKAPFDRVLVTAAPDILPRTLLDQLADGGVLVAPVGAAEQGAQQLLRYRKKGGRITSEDLGAVRFVPMIPGDTRGRAVPDGSSAGD